MITGKMLRDAVISASNNISEHRNAVDEMNVFPVPDGDTGSNMSMTMASAAKAVDTLSDDSDISEVADVTASALLRGARGNSGVILSLIFRGIAKGLEGCSKATAITLAASLNEGSALAYKSVMKPTEGTILTVIRAVAEKASEKSEEESSAAEIFASSVRAGESALKRTPELLPVLKRAKVVDAGGQGLIYILKGMESVFSYNNIIPYKNDIQLQDKKITVSPKEILYGYCTEYIVQKKSPSASCNELGEKLRKWGDCVLTVDDGDIIKVHAHSESPQKIIEAGLDLGELIDIKIENMRYQHSSAFENQGATEQEETEKKSFGFVPVCDGRGMESIFREIGADNIVSGGQTMNPSTGDILSAVKAVPWDAVFVLPNNENIIMAAEQAAKLSDKKVFVVKTKTVPQGIAAMLAFDENSKADENVELMTNAAKKIKTVQVTFAARDSIINGQQVKKGDIIALENGKITIISDSAVDAALKAVKHTVKKSSSAVTVFYGEGVTQEQSENLCLLLRAKLPGHIEITSVNGGQKIYYYIIGVE